MITLFCIAFMILCVLIAIPVNAYEGEPIQTNKQIALHKAADDLRAVGYSEDSEVIRALSDAWWREQEALDIIARVVQGEAGACPWMHQLAVAAVVVNRINSPLFPDNAYDVVAQPRQYITAYLTGFEQTSRQCYEAACKAMNGESGVPTDIIWQAEFPQGKEIWWVSEVDTGWFQSTTYFCR